MKRDLNSLMLKEEKHWKQRSRVVWLKEGDKNSISFHNKASRRRGRNEIEGIEDDNGCWQKDVKIVEGIFTNYFNYIFRSSNPASHDILNFLEPIESKISENTNLWL